MTSNNLKVSVVIPTHNSEKTITESIESLYKQTYPPFEIIIVDGRSKDSTIKKVQAFPEVKIVFNKEPDNPGSARNRGAETAAGDIIFFTDSDLIVDERAIEHHVNGYKNRDDISGVMGVIHSAGTRTFISDYVQKELAANQWVRFLKPDGTCEISGNWNFSIDRSTFLERKFKEDLVACEDTEFCIRIIGDLKILFEPRAIVYHYHPSTPKALFRQRKWYGQGLVGVMKYCKRESFNADSIIFQAFKFLDFEEEYLQKAIFQDNRLLCKGCKIQRCKIEFPKLPKHGDSFEYCYNIICLGYAAGILKKRTGIDYNWE